VADGSPPAAQSPRPQAARGPSPQLGRFDVLLVRPIDAAHSREQLAEFDVRYATGSALQTFRWPVVLDLQCADSGRRP
jgi:hypothetical protein